VIMAGQQPAHLTIRLLLSAQLPTSWAVQRTLLRLDRAASKLQLRNWACETSP
jgi:hypothetical protein